MPEPDQHQVALVRAAAVDGRARAAAEQRLGHQEAAALLEHGHERLVEAPRRAAADGGAHELLEQRVERHRQSLVALGRPGCPRP